MNERIPIIIEASFKIIKVDNRKTAACFVTNLIQDQYKIKRAFTLPNPTPLRCTLFSVILSYELYTDILNNENFGKEETDLCITVKNKQFIDIINDKSTLNK